VVTSTGVAVAACSAVNGAGSWSIIGFVCCKIPSFDSVDEEGAGVDDGDEDIVDVDTGVVDDVETGLEVDVDTDVEDDVDTGHG
jgi:hypothetical protein